MKWRNFMARKVKETPILTGKDAQRFDTILAENKSKKIPREEFQKSMESYRRFTVD